jgi:hypothetical protein
MPGRRHHLVGRRGLGDEGARPRLQRTEELIVTGVHGQHDDAHGRAGLAQGPGSVQAAAVGQSKVHDHDIGLEGTRLPDRLIGGGGLAHDLELPIALESVAEPAADEVVVVDE